MENAQEIESRRQTDAAISEFNDRVLRLRDENSVLDATEGDAAKHANIYRDYISKRVVRECLRPRGSDVILDFGCGIGRLSRYLSPFARTIEGVDRAEEMIKAAAASLPSNVRLRHVSSHLLPSESDYFDKAFTYGVLQHINDEELVRVLNEIRRVLKSGARFVCLEQTRKTSTWFGSICVHRRIDDYRRLFDRANFRERQIKQVIRYPSYSLSLWNRLTTSPRFVLPLLGLIEKATVNRKPEFEEYLTTAFILEK